MAFHRRQSGFACFGLIVRLSGHGAPEGPAQGSPLALRTYLMAVYSVVKVRENLCSRLLTSEFFSRMGDQDKNISSKFFYKVI